VSLRIRPADLVSDRSLIVDCLRRYLTAEADAPRFDWLYRDNPHGAARAWIAMDEARGVTVGVASAFPRRAVVDGKNATGWVLGDFCVHDEYRTLGPALQLQRTCLEAVDHGSAAFCYDFPSRSMMAVYRRLRVSPVGHVVRFARVLRWSARLRQSIRVPIAGHVLGSIASVADFRPPRRRSSTGALAVRPQTEPCGPEFDDLNAERRGSARIQLDRSAAHLNWRYRSRPGGRYAMLAARDAHGLRGFAVTDREAQILDLSARDEEAAEALLDESLAELWGAGAVTASCSLSASHSLAPLLVRRRFRAREASPVILHPGPELRHLAPLGERDLPLSPGDRES